MSAEELKRRKAHTKEFCEILVRRHGQNYYSSYDNQSRVTADETASRFGRYLRAARANAGLSIAELAAQTKLSEATFVALEQGLILACDIRPKWLRELANTLGENIEDFNLILGRQISSGNSRWLTEQILIHWRNLLAHSKISLSSRPIYATGSAILLCFVIGAFLFVGIGPSEQPPPRRVVNSFVDVHPERRLNMVKAELRLENQILVLSANLGNASCCRY